MVSQGQSDMDFLAGYDGGIQKGIATVANHHISPGKKLWTWGHGDFGDMWCSNLTDNDGPYIELMTGVYTDNQPDFTWLAPFESREFEQYWYPVRDIGDVKNASIDACMNFEQRGEKRLCRLQCHGLFPERANYGPRRRDVPVHRDLRHGAGEDLEPRACAERSRI